MQITLFGWRIRFDPRKPLQRELDAVKPALIQQVRAAVDYVLDNADAVSPDELRMQILQAVQTLPVSSVVRDYLRLKVLDWDIPDFAGEALKARLMAAEAKLTVAIRDARL